MKFIENKEAVSPVVGVMLMLVVTLIIAGVVSAFGGGLVSTTSATPQASITSSLTFGDSLKIQHNGGDTLVGGDIDVKAKIVSGTFADMVNDVVLINATLPRGKDGKFRPYDDVNYEFYYEKFQTGDVISVPWNEVIPKSTYYPYPDEAQKGDLVTITIIDKNSGKQISSQTVTVN